MKLDYQRNNPWGLLVSTFSHSKITQDIQGDNAIGRVTNEAHVFDDDDLLPIVLEERDVDTTSIEITNTAGTEFYTEGDDYTVTVVGDQVEIDPTIFGTEGDNIVDDQVLLIDYTFAADFQVDGEIVNQRFKLEQKFNNGLSVYFRRNSRDRQQKATGGRESQNGYMTNAFGASFRKGYYSFSAERSTTTSDLQSTESTRFNAGVNMPWGSKTIVTGKLSHSTLESTGLRARETTVSKVEAMIKRRLARQFRLTCTGELRKEDNSELGLITGTRFGVALEYKYRAISARLSWDSFFLERSNTQTNYSRIYASLIRRF